MTVIPLNINALLGDKRDRGKVAGQSPVGSFFLTRVSSLPCLSHGRQALPISKRGAVGSEKEY